MRDRVCGNARHLSPFQGVHVPTPNPNALAEFNTAANALVTAAHALAAHGVASDIAEGKKTLETARQAVSDALKAQGTKKA
jgi:hypothetical protein